MGFGLNYWLELTILIQLIITAGSVAFGYWLGRRLADKK